MGTSLPPVPSPLGKKALTKIQKDTRCTKGISKQKKTNQKGKNICKKAQPKTLGCKKHCKRQEHLCREMLEDKHQLTPWAGEDQPVRAAHCIPAMQQG